MIRNLVLVLALTMGSAHAATVWESMSFNPYIGIDYQYEHLKGNGDWYKFMPANLQNKAIFIGNRYHKSFGIELGYYSSLQTGSDCATLTSFNGQAASNTTIVYAHMRTKGFSIEWNAFLPLDPNFELFSVLGLVTIHPTLTIDANSTSNTINSNLATALRKVSGSNKTVLRLGFGAEYAEKSWGARGKILWDHTQKLYVDTNGAQQNFSTVTKRAFKQAAVVVVGVFYKF